MHNNICARLGHALVLAGLLATGCTKQLSQSAHITIQLPDRISSSSNKLATSKNAALPAAQADTLSLQHAAINVTASDIGSPLVLEWDNNSNNNAVAAAPTFTLTIPQGSARLFQALLVFQDSGSGALAFYYGDVSQDVDSSTNSVAISAAVMGAANTGQGTIAGRYMTAAGVGPTGPVLMEYTPTGKPAMIVHRTEMFGGWFNIFALQGQAFSYILPDGTPMFGGPIAADTTTNTALFPATASPKVVRISIPPLYRQQGDNNNNSTPNYQLQEQSMAVLGWFGPGALATAQTCYLATPTSLQNTYLDSGATTAVQWVYDGSGNTIHLTTAGYGYPGSLGSNNVTCAASGTQFVDYLAVDQNQLANQDSVLDFKGPFVETYQSGNNGGPNAMTIMPTQSAPGVNDTVAISFQYLPGTITTVGNPGVDGVDFYYRVIPQTYSNSDDYRANDGIACGALSTLAVPFNKFSSRPTAGVTGNLTDSFTGSLPPGTLAGVGAGTIQIVGCPFSGPIAAQVYYQSGMDWNMGGNNGSGSPLPPTHFKILSMQNVDATGLNIANANCTPLILQTLDATNNMSNLQNMMNLDLAPSDGTVAIYTDGYCSMPFSPSTGLPWAGKGYQFYVMRNTAGAFNGITLNASDATDGMTSIAVGVNFVDVTSPTQAMYVVTPTAAKAYTCYPLSVLGYDSTYGAAVKFPQGYSMVWPSNTYVTYYTDAQCSNVSSAPSTYMNPTQTLGMPVYFVYRGPAGAINLQPSTTTTPMFGGPVNGGTGIAFTAPGAVSRLTVMASPTMPVGSCQQVNVQLSDNFGNAAPAPAAGTVTVTSTVPGVFYPLYFGSCASCQGTTTSSMTVGLPAQSTGGMGCFMPSATVSGQFTATVSGITGVSTMPTSTNVTPPTNLNVYFFESGLVYEPTLVPPVAGASSALTNNTSETVTAYLGYSAGGQWYLYTQPINGVVLQSVTNATVSPSTINFVNGMATFQLTANGTPGNNIFFNVNDSSHPPLMIFGSQSAIPIQ